MEEKGSKVNILLMEGITIFFVMFVHSGTPNRKYIKFLDGDDRLIPNAIEVLVR